MKPTVLIAATTRWVPTARLVIALADAGFIVEIVCPPDHPLGKTRAARRTHHYHGFAPMRSLSAAIAKAQPDLLVPGDDLATLHLHRLYHRECARAGTGAAVSVLIERSLGASENFGVVFARDKFLQVARRQGIRAPKSKVIEGIADLKTWAEETGFPFVLKADGTSGGNGVKIVRTFKEAEDA